MLLYLICVLMFVNGYSNLMSPWYVYPGILGQLHNLKVSHMEYVNKKLQTIKNILDKSDIK